MTPLGLHAGLARFGHAAFRPGQREAIETLLDWLRACWEAAGT